MASPTLESVYLGQDSLQIQYIPLSTTTTSILDLIDSVKSYQHQQYEEDHTNGVASITPGLVLGRQNGAHFASQQRAILHI